MQSQVGHHAGKRDKQQRGRNQVGEKDSDAQPLAPAAGEPRQGIGGGKREQQRDDHHDGAHQRGIAQPAQKIGFGEKQAQVFQRRRQVEDERIVLHGVQVDVPFEGGDHHPVKRKGQQHGEQGEHQRFHRRGPGVQPGEGALYARRLQIPDQRRGNAHLRHQENGETIMVLAQRVQEQSHQAADHVRREKKEEQDAGAVMQLPQAEPDQQQAQHRRQPEHAGQPSHVMEQRLRQQDQPRQQEKTA